MLEPGAAAMKHKSAWQAAVGMGLLVLGALLAFFPSMGYEQQHVIAATSGCRVDLVILQKKGAAGAGE